MLCLKILLIATTLQGDFPMTSRRKGIPSWDWEIPSWNYKYHLHHTFI
jgi:hypothetical protein